MNQPFENDDALTNPGVPAASDENGIDDDAVEADMDELQMPIKHLEDGVWHAPRGTATRIAALVILLGFVACLIGLIVMLVIGAKS